MKRVPSNYLRVNMFLSQKENAENQVTLFGYMSSWGRGMCGVWIGCGSDVDRKWIRCGLHMDQMWIRCGSDVDQMWIRCGSDVDQMWIACGSDVDQMWIRCGSDVDQMWIRCGSDVDCMWIRLSKLALFLFYPQPEKDAELKNERLTTFRRMLEQEVELYEV